MAKAQITLKQVQAQYQDDLFDRVTEALDVRGLPRDLARIHAHIDAIEAIVASDAHSPCVKAHVAEALADIFKGLSDAAQRLQTVTA